MTVVLVLQHYTEGDHRLQTSLLTIQHLLKRWRIKAYGSKSIHVTFITQRETCPSVQIMYNFPKRKMSSILGYVLTEDLPSTNTSLQNGNNYVALSRKCTGCSDVSQSSQ
jgi:hypothetical protein